MTGPEQSWIDAASAAALFAVDPHGTGVLLRARPGHARDWWLATMRNLLPSTRVIAVPLHASDERLLGGLDLAATLHAGRPIATRGLLAEADGGILQLAMAERMDAGVAARIGAVIDTGDVIASRDGLTLRDRARFGVVALDEGIDDEHPPRAIVDRLAFHLSLEDAWPEGAIPALPDAGEVARARNRLPSIRIDDEAIKSVCATTLALGIASARAPLMALRVARAAAALDGRNSVGDDDILLAARLVLAPRATVIPVHETAGDEAAEPPPQPGDNATLDDDESTRDDAPLEDRVLTAAKAAIPEALLAQLLLAQTGRARSSGKSGTAQKSVRHGRPAGVLRGELRGGTRLNVVATLRAAAPWQAIRRRERPATSHLQIRRDDFRITRFKKRSETVAIFVVDASGSSALHRLAEAKGAVELLLADCYVRRDQVALLAFRGKSAEMLLPPTRSLVRARRSLAGLPGGGGTPLARALDAAGLLADGVRRKGQTPIVILLTDGRANVARDGSAGRERAAEDAVAAARALRAASVTSLLLDTSPQPQPTAAKIADAMGGQYVPLPHADAARLSRTVLAAMPR